MTPGGPAVPALAVLDEYVGRGLLTRSDLDHLSLYNYSKACTFAHAWDDVTCAARGLLIDRRTGEPAALSFSKFFNHDEHGVDVWLPEGPPDCVTVKFDGSLGISYRHEGRLRWTTRGSLHSEHGQAAQAIWDARYAAIAGHIPDDWTLLVEIIHPVCRNVVRYDFEDLIVLGIRNRRTGEDFPLASVRHWCGLVGMRCVEEVPLDFAAARDRAATLDHQNEGFVVRWGDHRVKVKSGAYCEVARLLQGLNERRVADYWAAGASLPEVLPEESRAWADSERARLDAREAEVRAELAALLAPLPRDNRRAFVEAVGPRHPLFSLAMRAFDGRDPDVRLHVYRERFDGKPRPASFDAAEAA